MAEVIAPVAWPLSSKKATLPESTVVAKPIMVDVAKVQQSNIPITVSALGGLSAVQVVKLSSVASGRIAQIYFKDGQKVAKGMPIVQLDNAQAKANYESATTALQLARTKYQRSKQLLNTAISQQALDQLKAEVATDEAKVKSALASLNQQQVDAPFAGVLGAFSANVGDYVNAGDALVTLVNTKELRVNYSLPEHMLAQLRQGQLVSITTSAYPHKAFYGTVSFISPIIDPSTRTIAVQAMIPNAKNLLLPGMFVHVANHVGIKKKALLIPDQALSADVKGYYVYKVLGKQVQQVYVDVGSRRNGSVQIVKGLQPGNIVVTEGIQKLQDGSSVEFIQQAEPVNQAVINSSSKALSS